MPVSAASRFRYSLAAGSTAVVIGAGFLVAGLTPGGTESPAPSSVNGPLAAAAGTPSAAGTPAAVEGDLLLDPAVTGSPAAPSVSASPSAPATGSAAPKPRVTKTGSTAATSKKQVSTSASKAATSAPVTSGSVVERVLAHINDARIAEGLEALTLDTELSKAAALHTQLMIDGCGLSHRCSGEKELGDRFTAQGVSWGNAGENIGYGSSGSSDAAMVEAANGLTDAMLAEVPPNDGHRKNLLSTKFTRIGLSVVRDADGVTWVTQDFAG